jgi:hypothetical protein
MRLGKHQRGEAAHRVADHVGGSELLPGQIAVQVGDDPVEQSGLQVIAGRVAAEAVDLDQDDAVVARNLRRDLRPHLTRRGQAGDQHHGAAAAVLSDRDVGQRDDSDLAADSRVSLRLGLRRWGADEEERCGEGSDEVTDAAGRHVRPPWKGW